MAVNERFFCGGMEFRREADAIQHGSLVNAEVRRETRRADQDPVLGHGVHRYVDGGWEWLGPLPGTRPRAADPENHSEPPVCQQDCLYRQEYRGLSSQRNALRIELASLVATERCGWNLLPGRIGGEPLDYAPCILGRHSLGEHPCPGTR